MNEFTKEELMYLLELIDSIGISNRSVNDDELQEKLQSMIDNYCEHSKHIYYGDIPVGECTECHMVMIP